MTQSDKNENPVSKRKGLSLPDRKAHLLFWPVIIAGVALDLWSKHAVFAWLETVNGREFSIIAGLCKFVMRLNAGAAFSIASGQRVILVTVSAVALTVVIGLFLFGNIKGRVMQFALGIFTAGIIGNLYDRAFNDGLVRDFIDVYYGDYHWPAFNAADSMLCIAVGLFVIINITSASCQKSSR